ncbi:MAG: hypothetical protein PHS02_00180 [Candidatus ainarchaeum sp.]|nr:hypothetical protein [Candidatus ainarchaeum sp.]
MIFDDGREIKRLQGTVLGAFDAIAGAAKQGSFRTEAFQSNLGIVTIDSIAALSVMARMEEHFRKYRIDTLGPEYRKGCLFEAQVLAFIEVMTRLDFSNRKLIEVPGLLEKDEERILASASVLSHTIHGVNARHVPAIEDALEEFRMNRGRGINIFCDVLCNALAEGGWAEESVKEALVIAKYISNGRGDSSKLDFLGSAAGLLALAMAENYEGEKFE